MKRYKLNVGGTRYEITDSLLDQFPNSMLRRITSDTWNTTDNNNSNLSEDDDDPDEIFIERDGSRFKFVLEYMKYGKVFLPLSIPRIQLIHDMEYYGIDFKEEEEESGSRITPGVTTDDPNNITFQILSEYFYEKEKFRQIFEDKKIEIDGAYRKLAIENVSSGIALQYLEQQFSGRFSFTIKEGRKIRRGLGPKEDYDYTVEELQPYLDAYRLSVSNLERVTDYNFGAQVECLELQVKSKIIIPTTTTTMTATTTPISSKVEEVTSKSVCSQVIKRKEDKLPKRYKLNVGGIRYEVSESLLDQFPDSMLRRITSSSSSENNNTNEEGLQNKNHHEIYIERDGERFKFVLDYMRDHKVVLPLSVSRPQLVSDMEYYGIDFVESQITLAVADPNDTFHQLSAYFHKKERIRQLFESKQKEFARRYRELAVESISYKIALQYFEQQFSGKSFFVLDQPKKIRRGLGPKEEYNFTIEDLEPHLNVYGLGGLAIGQTTCYIGQGLKKTKVSYIELEVKML